MFERTVVRQKWSARLNRAGVGLALASFLVVVGGFVSVM